MADVNIKPSDFFIGVIDFFSVILPGALLTFFLKGLLYARMFGEGKIFPELHNEVQKAIAFLLATYVVGNLIFLMGSSLLDDLVYDRVLRRIFFKKNFDLAYLVATDIREQHLSSATSIEQLIDTRKLKDQDVEKLLANDKREVVNTFKWSQDYLSVKFPLSVTEIEKLKADSKFFRSLVIVFLIIAGILLVKGFWIWAACFFLLSLFSVYRYGDLRYKSTQKAYELIVAVDRLEKNALSETPKARDNRARFLAPAETVRAFQNRIASLIKGLQVSTGLMAIPPTETWKVVDSQSSETVLCLQGRGMLTNRRAAGEDLVTVFPGAMVVVPLKSTFEMSNSGGETVIVLSVK